MSSSSEQSCPKLYLRVARWRATKLLRFCWFLAAGQDLRLAGFDFDENDVEWVRSHWPIGSIIAAFSRLGGSVERFKLEAETFAKGFVAERAHRLQNEMDDVSKAQMLWLKMASRRGLQGLLNRLLKLATSGLQAKPKSLPSLYYQPPKPTKPKSEDQILRSQQLARGRRLVVAGFTEALLAQLANQLVEEDSPIEPDAPQQPFDHQSTMAETPPANPSIPASSRGPPG